MTFSSIIRRVLLVGPTGVIALLLLGVVLVRLEEHMLRKRAERLAIDFRSVVLEKSSLNEAKLTFRRWGKYEADWGRDRETSCDQMDCVLAVSLTDFYWNHTGIFRKRWISRAYLLIGGRAARIDARVHLRNGVVWDERISMQASATGSPDGAYVLAVDAQGWTLDGAMSDILASIPDHYQIGGAANCWPCIHFDFSSQIDPDQLQRLLQFDFSCLSRFSGCHSPAELMPNAWGAFAAQEEKYCASRMESDIRRAWNIATFDVIATHTAPRGEFATVRLIHLVRGNASFRAGSRYKIYVSAPANAEGVRRGSKLIILFLDLFPEPDNYIMPLECGTIYLNERNMALVNTGLTAETNITK